MTLAFWQRFFAGGTSRLYLKSASCGIFLVCRPGAIVLGAAVGRIPCAWRLSLRPGEKSGRISRPGRAGSRPTESFRLKGKTVWILDPYTGYHIFPADFSKNLELSVNNM